MAPSQLFRWRKVILAHGLVAAVPDGQATTVAADLWELRHQIRELERLLGKKTLENETLREAIAREKSKTESRFDPRKEAHTLLKSTGS
jgi:transposase